MRGIWRGLAWGVRGGVVCGCLLMSCGKTPAQAVGASGKVAAAPPAVASVESESESAATQTALVKLVKLSPVLQEVVERDPSLLGDAAYVGRVNPALETFLTGHPEVVRNPDFYLFTEFNVGDRRHREVLQKRGLGERPREVVSPELEFFGHDVIPFLVFVCFMVAVIWMVHVFLQNRRWTRMSRLQTEAHGKLMDRFGNNQEVLAYMQSEAGRRFLEAAPISIEAETGQRLPNVLSRVLMSFQVGAVLGLLGAGLLAVKNMTGDGATAMLVLGIVFFMPGIGFVVSAGVTWLAAMRLGLLPGKGHTGAAE